MPRPTVEARRPAPDPVPALLVAALGLGAALQLLLPPPQRPLGAALGARKVRLSEPATDADAAAPAYPVILARPLFSPSRSAEAVEASAPYGAFALLGVAAGGGGAAATLRDAAGGVRTLRLGETIDGWRLAAVGRASAELARAGTVQSLRVGELPTAAAAAPGRDIGAAASRSPDRQDR